MNWIQCDSSKISEYRYNSETLEFDIKYRSTGEIYRYFEVPKGIYEKFQAAQSKGSFSHHFIEKAGYSFKKLVSTPEVDLPRRTVLWCKFLREALDILQEESCISYSIVNNDLKLKFVDDRSLKIFNEGIK